VGHGEESEIPEGGESRVATLEAAVAERDARLAEQQAQLATQKAQIGFLTAQVAKLTEQQAQLAEQQVQLEAQKAQIALLTAQVAKLTEQQGRNSSNSHLPPSSDGPGSGTKDRRRGKSGRKRGGQKGHRGSHRELLPPERVDRFVDLFPPACLCCGHPLPRVVDTAAWRYQQLDLRDHRVHLTEWRRHEVTCERCGESTRAEYDRTQIPELAFGPCLTAVVVLLTGAYHLSRRKARKLLQELFGISISTGAISAMEKRASEALAEAHEEAKHEAQHAAVKHSDATSFLRSGTLTSLWVLATAAATVYQIFNDGRRDTIRPLFGPRLGILISDRATVFSFWTMALRQVCHSHLLRKFVAFSERDGPDGAIGCELLECMTLIFEYWHGFKDGHLTRAELSFWMQPLQRHVEQLLQRASTSASEGISGSCADILAHRDALWTFVSHEGVEPTNNHAELELRDFVLWRRRSFGTRSERGDRFAEHVMTVVRTARKQGLDVLDFLVRSITASVDNATAPKLLGAAA
jgi:transposase